MRKRYRELMLSSIAQRLRRELGAPKALNAPLVVALEDLKERAAVDHADPQIERAHAERDLKRSA